MTTVGQMTGQRATTAYATALAALRTRYPEPVGPDYLTRHPELIPAAPPATTPPVPIPPLPDYPLVKKGDEGRWVEKAQRLLIGLGYVVGRARADWPLGKPDRDFGTATEAAVRKFQGEHTGRDGKPLTADGKVGRQTWWALENPAGVPAGAVAGLDVPDPGAHAVAHAIQHAKSPWPDVPNAAWRAFVSRMAVKSVGHTTPRGALGMFMYDPRRLQDLGLMGGVVHDEATGRYVGEFRSPMTLRAWLANPALQVRTLAADAKRLRARIESRFARAIGQEFAGRRATLSGLLAVAHATGPERLASWIARDGDRGRFEGTTVLYGRATGIF